jgi:phosphomethylpyrimidine synthase
MKITQDVRDYAGGLSDNEKADLEAMSDAERKKGMDDMSQLYREKGSELYLDVENG